MYNPEQLASEFTTDSKSGRRVGFIGLGAMGFGMATHLLSSKFWRKDLISHFTYGPVTLGIVFCVEGG